MKAADIMTSPAITVTPDTQVREVAAILGRRGISAVPVVERDHLVGIVSEADLLYRHEIGTDCALSRDPWWLRIFQDNSDATEYVRSHAVRVEDIMTHDVATVRPDTPLAKIAAVFDKRRVKRVPVVDQGRVIGIVSRSDVVGALAACKPKKSGLRSVSDEAIRARLVSELEGQSWWRPDMSVVAVERGVVTYRGLIDFEDERAAARIAAEGIRGVRRIEDMRIVARDLPSML